MVPFIRRNHHAPAIKHVSLRPHLLVADVHTVRSPLKFLPPESVLVRGFGLVWERYLRQTSDLRGLKALQLDYSHED